MICCTRFLRTYQIEVLLFKQISKTAPRALSSSEILYNEIPPLERILCHENRENCVKKFKSIKISPRSKPIANMKKAAVLIPLCIVNDELSLLYTLRRANLKRHRGQVSFPGGIQDDTDLNLEETALRETEEELGIQRSSVDLWGSGSIVIGMEFCVLPVLGFLGPINLKSLKPNPDEVETVFVVTLKHFCDLDNCRFTQFRVGSDKGYVLPAYINAQHRVWGITALITHIVLCSLLPDHYGHKLEYIKPIILSPPIL